MKKMIPLKKIVLTLLSLILITGSVFAQSYQNGVKQGTLRVKFKPQLSSTLNSVTTSSVGGVIQTGIQPFDKVSAQLSAVKMKRVFPYSPLHEAKHQKYGLHLWYEVSYTSAVSPEEAVAGYAGIDEISAAEPILEKITITGEVKYVATPSSTNEPYNDTHLSKQWHYNNTGDQVEGSLVGADINLYKAWEIETGKPNVVVCVVDGGVDVDHEDLAANMWVNQAELNGEEGVDDDGNGYVDDINGYNFVNDKGEISDHFHGTHVAGTVAAVTNNGIGVAGVAGGSGNNDGVRIMTSQVFTEDGGTGDYPAAIAYGADNGAVISQNSWGYTTPGHSEQAIHDAIDYFIAEAGKFEGSPMQGGVVFFASGNMGKDGEWYPGYYESAIAVSSFGANLRKAGYSNFGTWVDIAAPGGNTYLGTEGGILSTLPNNKYGFLEGTSMACPHVSGVAALVVSKFGGETFTNEDLKNHIFTATHDIDKYNPDYIGKMGVGYIDTWLALQSDNGIAPNPVADLALVGIAQDFATLTWSTPSDEDDIQSVGFEALYSTEAITNENADLAEKISVNQKDTVGTQKEIEITGLEAETTYHFAIRSIDRWGNVSEVSNVISGTTNAGPAINTDQAVMNFTIDASVATTAGGSFNILNEAEGVLKWEGFTRQKSLSLSYSSVNLNYPEASVSVSQKNFGLTQLVQEKLVSTGAEAAPMSTVQPMATFYDEYYYGSGAATVIGENDTTFTNSSATRYYVDRENGFNLTDVEMMLKHKPVTGPMIMEIYAGEQIDKKNLIYATEVTSYTADAYFHNIKLDEQLYFENGTAFWIVFHVPSGNLYPLGMVAETQPEYSDNCLMSLDMGKTWFTLEEGLDNPNYTWSTAAVSKNAHLGNYITMDPSSGIVEANSTQEVELSVDGSTLINGTYKANVVLQSNDGDDKFFRMPVNLTVSGQEPVLVNEKVVDFGSVFLGHDKELTITIENTGYGNFMVQSTVSTDDQFEVIKKPNKIAAKDMQELIILYTPNGVGNDNGSIEFTDRAGRKHTINLFGVAAAPSEISIAPASQQLGDMAIGDTTSTSFTITNTGDYPLEYAMPSFAPDAEIEGMSNIHKFGYTLESNANGDTSAVYSWNDISENGTDVSAFFKDESYSHRFKEVDLGFEFPFYGDKLEKISLTRFGILTLSAEAEQNVGGCSSPYFGSNCCPNGFISAIYDGFDINRSGHMYYSREPGKFIVQYQDVLQRYSWNETQTITFQIVLFYNGDIEFRYKDIERFNSYNLKKAFIAVGDPAHEDGFLVNGQADTYGTEKISDRLSANETVFRVKAPGQKMITSVSEPYGMIKVGESKTINVELSTEGMIESNLMQRLAIISNDPFNNPAAFTVKVDVTSGGVADVNINKDTVEMGQVFQGGSRKDMVVIKNDGNKDVEISSIALADSKFTLSGEAPYLLKAKSSYYVYVEMITTNKGVMEDVLTVETSDGKSFECYIHGEVIPAPGIAVDTTPISETLDAGEMVIKTFTIENNGEADLEIVPATNDWLHLAEVGTMDMSLKNFTYYALDSDDEDGPVFNWEVVRGEGTRISRDWYTENEKLWKAVPLPYELTFYNQPTDTIWISWEGAIAMSKPEINPGYWFPSPIPTDDEVNNIIAPYFAPQNYDYLNSNVEEEVGVFYKIHDDRVVVEWAECIDLFGMGNPYSYEAIIFKNGNIKFQYKTGSWSGVTYGVIGVENADGSDGVQLAHMQKYFKDGLAVSLIPAEKQIIPAGESKELNVAIDAKLLNKGEYTGNFRIFNNSPQNPEVIVPVSLTVNGEPGISTDEVIEYGEVMAYEVMGDFGLEAKAYTQDFMVKNPGRDVLNFSSIHLQDGSEAKVEIEYTDPGMGWTQWVELEEWNLPTLVSGDKVRLRMRLMPSGTNAELNDTLVFVSNLPSGDHKLPIHASVILPPAIELGQDTVSVMANTPDHQEVKTLTIDNTNGQSDLNYQLDINFFREGEVQEDSETSAVSNVFVSQENLLQVDVLNVNSIKPFSEEESYNTVLEYDTLTTPSTAIGFGGGKEFIAGTAFQAPEAGLNLTHVKTWYRSETLLDSRIQVEIRAGGTSAMDAQILTQQGFDYHLEEEMYEGQYITIELEESQIFYPGETFYVVITYPLGVQYPQAVARGVENVEGRFFYSDGQDWGDYQASFPGEGWMMKALEKEAKGGAWVTVDGELEGALPAGESLTVNLAFEATKALDIDNICELIIISNDPLNPEERVDLLLHKNQGPQFDLESDLTVNENETLNFVVPAQDVEGDVCTYALADNYEFVQMSVQNDTINFVYTPDFEAAGLNTFTLRGEDAHGNETTLDIPVEVVNVNRAPELVVNIDAREYYEDEEFDYINLFPIFTDPDNEVLSYSVTVDNPVVSIFTTEDEIAIRPLEPGVATINVVASDSEGLSAETSFSVTIGTVTGIEDVEGTSETKVYPVPTTGPLNIVLGKEIEGEVSISILNVTGLTQFETTVNKMSGEQLETLNISDMASGIYLVKITSAKGEIVKRVVKM